MFRFSDFNIFFQFRNTQVFIGNNCIWVLTCFHLFSCNLQLCVYSIRVVQEFLQIHIFVCFYVTKVVNWCKAGLDFGGMCS